MCVSSVETVPLLSHECAIIQILTFHNQTIEGQMFFSLYIL